MRLYRFSPAENLVRVQTFSPWTGKFKTDPASQFEFGYHMDSGPLAGSGVPNDGPSVISGEAAPGNP